MEPELLDAETVTFQYTIPCDELDIDRDSVARAMGYADGAEAMPFAESLDGLIGDANQHAALEGGFRIFPPNQVQLGDDAMGKAAAAWSRSLHQLSAGAFGTA